MTITISEVQAKLNTFIKAKQDIASDFISDNPELNLFNLFNKILNFDFNYNLSAKIEYWTKQNTIKEEIEAELEKFAGYYKTNPDNIPKGFEVIKNAFLTGNIKDVSYFAIKELTPELEKFIESSTLEGDIESFVNSFNIYAKWKKIYEVAFNKDIKGSMFVRTPFTKTEYFFNLIKLGKENGNRYRVIALSPVQQAGIGEIFRNPNIIDSIKNLAQFKVLNNLFNTGIRVIEDKNIPDYIFGIKIHQMEYNLIVKK